MGGVVEWVFVSWRLNYRFCTCRRWVGVPGISVLDRSKNARPFSVKRRTLKFPSKQLNFQKSSSPLPLPLTHTHTHRQPVPAIINNVIMHHSLGVGLEAKGRGFGHTTDKATYASAKMPNSIKRVIM